jgi:hypothetical protein
MFVSYQKEMQQVKVWLWQGALTTKLIKTWKIFFICCQSKLRFAVSKEESGGSEQNSSVLCESLEIAAVTRLGNCIASRPFG